MDAHGRSIGFFSFGVELSFSRDVHVTQFALYNEIAMDGRFRFVIFDRPGRDPLYQGDPISFAKDDGPTFKRSDVLDFTFRAGQTYALGAISDVGMAMSYLECGPVTIDGITATGRNSNFLGMIEGATPPSYIGSAQVQGFVRLYDDAPPPVPATSSVPEPSNAAMVGGGGDRRHGGGGRPVPMHPTSGGSGTLDSLLNRSAIR